MSQINKVYYDIENNFNKKILLLTDIHYYSKKNIKKLNKVLDSIEDDLDYICISGDFIDCGKIKDCELFVDWLNKLSKKAFVLISLGGHDIISTHKDKTYYYNNELYSAIKKISNVKLLDNTTYEDNEIRFIGITLPLDYYYKYNENRNYFKRYINNTYGEYKNKYNILLCHTPINVTSYNDEDINLLNCIDMTLCGHMHAGIVPKFLRKIFKGRGIFSPAGKGMFPKNAYGYIKNKKNNIIISSGVTKASNSNPFKFTDVFFDIELTYINIKK